MYMKIHFSVHHLSSVGSKQLCGGYILVTTIRKDKKGSISLAKYLFSGTVYIAFLALFLGH